MKIRRYLVVSALLTALTYTMAGQDVRLLSTRVADLLAQMPARDSRSATKLMDEMFSMGRGGHEMIFSQLVTAGSGDDSRVRMAIEQMSRYLSRKDEREGADAWEKTCLEWITRASDSEVKIFLISQLNYIGSDQSLPVLDALLGKPEVAEHAVIALVSVGTPAAAGILHQSLGRGESHVAAAVLNGLASAGSGEVTPEMISYAGSTDAGIKAAAYRALAVTGQPGAIPVLLKAAEAARFNWESTGATASLLELAENLGYGGKTKEMDRILKTVMSKTTSVQYKSSVLELQSRFNPLTINRELVKVMKGEDVALRGKAMSIAAGLQGDGVTSFWITSLKNLGAERKAEVVAMLGNRGDKAAIPVLRTLLADPGEIVRTKAAVNLAALEGSEAIPALTDYLLMYENGPDQEAAASALVTLLDSRSMAMLAEKLRQAGPMAGSTIIGLLAWSRNEEYFPLVMGFTGSQDDGLRSAAIMALKSLAGEANQADLIALLDKTTEKQEISELQLALVASAARNSDTEARVEKLTAFLHDENYKDVIIPVLSRLGGSRGATAVLKEFENGSSQLRELAFEALLYWPDHYALDALYNICASGNKNYGKVSFDAFVRQTVQSRVTADQKLLNLKKIYPFALTPEQKEMVIEAAGSIRTYQALFFVGQFLDDPGLAATAARSVMNIALPPAGEVAGMNGSIVKTLLGKSIESLTGNESEYDKERMRKYLSVMTGDEGFVPMFNGHNLDGWKGLVGNPVTRSRMTKAELDARQKEADRRMLQNWSVRDGMIWFSGSGDNLCSVKEYGDFEMLVDWKITRHGDSGIYLRGSPQVQIWDTSRVDVGAQVGSGGLYNNQKHPSKPLVVADNAVGEWNTFRIIMEGERVTVFLNGILVVDDVVMENYWDRSIPVFPTGPVELQAHGTDLAFRDIYIREIKPGQYNLTSGEQAEGFVALFNGKNLDGWTGDKISYVVEDGNIVVKPERGSTGNLFTSKEYSDFVFRFEFQLTPGANNGLGIRAPLEGDAAYAGMELQILDDTAPIYANLRPYQYHGSVYGVIPARRGYQKPVGEWNYQEVIVKGTSIKIILNGTVIIDGDIAEARDKGTIDGEKHPGLQRTSGHIGFLGHGSPVKFRNIRIMEF